MKILLSLLLMLPAWGLQYGNFGGSTRLSFTGANVTVTDYRVEFRLSGFSINAGARQGVFGDNAANGFSCFIQQATLDLYCHDSKNSSFYAAISLTGRPDVRVRYQRFFGTSARVLEVWNADGSGYTTATATTDVSVSFNFNAVTTYVGAQTASATDCTCLIHFVRWWSTTLPLASSAPPDIVTANADLMDLELEGVTTDTSGRSTAVTTTGSLSYGTTTTYPPVAVIVSSVGRAGSSVALSGTTSSNLYSDAPLSYFWNTASGGWTTAAPIFSSRTSSAPTVTLPTAGTFTIRLTVTDASGAKGVDDELVGAVATDANSILISTDTTNDRVLGPMLKSGSSPWTWFDTSERGIADAIIATIGSTPGNTALVGTISLTNGSTTVTGSGTTFLSTFACNGTDHIMVHYPLASGTGRRVYTVASCSSDTSMIISDTPSGYDAPSTPVSPTGVSYGKSTAAEEIKWAGQSNNWNYYDAVVALYRLYYRTGITTYRDAARSLADKVWVWPFDGGRAFAASQGFWEQSPRLLGLFGLMLRANDGQSSYWTGIESAMGVIYPQYVSGYFPGAAGDNIYEMREQGYVALFTELMATLHPNSGTRATWSTNAASTLSYFLTTQTAASGSWKYQLNPAFNYYGAGNLPWQAAFMMNFMRLHHERTGTATALSSIKTFADYFGTHGFDSSNDGGFYDDSYFTFCPDDGNVKAGTVTATNGSTSVSGSGTLFLTEYACNGTDSIGIQDSTGNRRSYTVVSCASNIAMTIASGYGGATASGLRILKYAGASATPSTGCQASYGTGSAAKSAARTLLNGMHSYWGYLYAQGQGAGYKTRGDVMFSENLGLNGTGNDGVVGNYADVLSSGSYPSYAASTYYSKEFAFAGGASGAQPYLGWRIGGLTPLSTTSFTVTGKLSSVANATQIRVTITQPSGATATNTCSADSCTVTGIDTRQGSSALMKIEYLSAGSAVLASGDQQQVTIN